jgi:hypothetical protein
MRTTHGPKTALCVLEVADGVLERAHRVREKPAA